MTVAGTTAIVVGAAVATVGLAATPALADAALMYRCTGTTDTTQQPVGFDLAVAVTGSVTATPKVGDPVKLDGFTVTADATVPALAVGIDHVSGAFTSFPVNATAGDGTDAGSADPGADNSLPIDVNVAAGGVLHLTTPDAALTLTGFTANAPGSMSFDAGTIAAHLTLTGPDKDTQEPVTIDTVSVTCTGGGQVATVDVPEPAQTTTSAPPTTGTQGGDDDHNGDDDKTASHPATTASVTTATTTSASVVRNVSARGTLANTGTPYTLPMTGTGAALVLLGAGLLVASRRRHVLPEGMTEQD